MLLSSLLLLRSTVPAQAVGGGGDPSDWATVKAKILALGTAKVTVQAPVLASGEIQLTRGDAYKIVDNRALSFSFENINAARLASVHLILNNAATLSVLGIMTATETGVSVRFELSAAQTQALRFSSSRYFVQAVTVTGDPFDLGEGTVTIRAGSE